MLLSFGRLFHVSIAMLLSILFLKRTFNKEIGVWAKSCGAVLAIDDG